MSSAPPVALALEEPGTIADLEVGELVAIADLSDEQLAAAMGKAKRIGELLSAKKDDLAIEAIARMDRKARWTLELAGVRLEGGSPKTGIDYSASGLKAELDRLVEDGTISEEARDAAVELVEPKPELKVRKKGLEALAKLGNERIDQAVKAAETPKKRTVKIKLEDAGA